MNDLLTDDAHYSYEECLALINTFSSQVRGQHITTDRTPRRNTISGVADGFLLMPYKPGSYTFDLALFNYNLAAVKQDWLAARRRDGHRWIPLVQIAKQYVALVPILLQLHLWNENWRMQ
ncbi:hypothetical protein E4631_24355 [Hymenobacter sp. UV11]|uniref:hypothetical protein n=1 Tax=Hymenobacter sp. UV11 TaxID=1849735 RepID=UPI00105FC3D4|nr:hypothetical protein [Hymenobacter sp. UV11]TDN39899.1 hypothetical protein A8B98_16480 [Hymenobacter sp. UV11]TFZ62853.1 hypothetical protein E4631_24355 [Hymenobacter sp. UV11]